MMAAMRQTKEQPNNKNLFIIFPSLLWHVGIFKLVKTQTHTYMYGLSVDAQWEVQKTERITEVSVVDSLMMG